MASPDRNEITPEPLYLNRRNFIRAGVFAGSAAVTGLIYRAYRPDSIAPPPEETPEAFGELAKRPEFQAAEAPNSFEDITNYNNFYEFSTSKTAVAREAQALKTDPWSVEVGGMVESPRTYSLQDILNFPQEERIYRFRCVEAWSMVIPWVGFPLAALLEQVKPNAEAKYVAFETAYDRSVMQSSFSAGIDFPYVEGLRLDEALHPLTLLATGLYGRPMPKQNGAPIRLVVPWKYGFKSIKSIVRITLTDKEPPTTWNIAAPREYGFYSNVNPNVDHPRWSQKRERRIGEITMRETLMFNGYEKEVADLYRGMDLEKFY